MMAGAASEAGLVVAPYHQRYSRSASALATGVGTARLVTPKAWAHSFWS